MGLFGTDGIRAIPNLPPLDLKTVVSCGKALARKLKQEQESPSVLIVRDTRETGPFLVSCISAGLMSEGVSLHDAGVLPTPACSALLLQMNLQAGVVVSASHNPASDNGLKFFNSQGLKFSKEEEKLLEKLLEESEGKAVESDRVGALRQREDAKEAYLDFLTKKVEPLNLSSLHLVVDCANGATTETAPALLQELGAKLSVIGSSPDGQNINLDCGSERPQEATKRVLAEQAHGGIVFDGDGDRTLLIDEKGNLLTGDHIMAALAVAFKEKGQLFKQALLCTEYSNKGLDLSLAQHGIKVHRFGVGDRDVAYALRERGLKLGGEQSGHVILADILPTGDGLLTALHVIKVALEWGKSLSELSSIVTLLPQTLLNLPVPRKVPLAQLKRTCKTIEEVQSSLGGRGRIYVRYSGTQNLLRIMVEGEDEDKIREYAEAVGEAALSEIGKVP